MKTTYHGNTGSYKISFDEPTKKSIEIIVTPIIHSSNERGKIVYTGGVLDIELQKNGVPVGIIELHTSEDLKSLAFPEDEDKAISFVNQKFEVLAEKPELTTMVSFLQKEIEAKNGQVFKAILYHGLGLAIGFEKIDGKTCAMKMFPNRTNYH